MSENQHTPASENCRNEWGPCPAGTVARLVGTLKHRNRLQKIRRGVAVAVCLLAIGLIARPLLAPDRTPPHALSHAEVVELVDDYIQGKLDEPQMQLVEAHIDVCPACRHLREDRRAYLEKLGAQVRPGRDVRTGYLALSSR